MKYRRRLFSAKSPYDTNGTEELFLRAVRENCLFHYTNCPEYRKLLDGLGFGEREIVSDSLPLSEYLARLPFIPTLLFKRRRMFSVPRHRMFVKATSSGTSGRFSEIGFDAGGLLCGLKMVLRLGRQRGLFSLRPCRYIVTGYQPHRGNRTAVTKTAFGATLFTPCISRKYVLKYANGKYSPDFDGTVEAVVRYSKKRAPVRFMGFPAYMYFLMREMERRGVSVRLPKGSKIMLGGGWKQFYAEQADKDAFYRLAEKVLGVSDKDVVEFYGAVEHPIMYTDCPNHRFHIPVYSRVLIRDCDTLEPLPPGETGLVNLITPMICATPILSVMTDDLGVLRDGAECGCGIRSPYLEIIGRVAPDSIKTCAAGASEILSESISALKGADQP
ncbi:MAG: acyl-protein synthetase [Oscillospiraceae bacterium]|nr:acyl-protein synthetase [Oscillospiraceae bacterium]